MKIPREISSVLCFFSDDQPAIYFLPCCLFICIPVYTRCVYHLQRMAGGEYLGFNNSIFLSERDSADRNSALGYFMRENMCYPSDKKINITDTLDFYFQVLP